MNNYLINPENKIHNLKKKTGKKFISFLEIEKTNLEKNISQQEKDRILKEANRILRHNFSILSQKIKFGRKINWHTNFGKKSWPIIKYQKINLEYLNDFNSSKYIGDVKLPWEFSKHLHFQELAKAYALTRDEEYAKEFKNEINDWLDKNPYGYGVNWTQGLIVAHRAISWLISLGSFAQSKQMEGELLGKIVKSLYEHADFIEKTYEIGERSTNHLIGEVCAMIFLCVCLPDLDRKKERLDRAVGLLGEQLMKQIYDDGVSYEQSTSYHRYELEFLFLPLLLEKRKLLKLPKIIGKQAEKMAEFLMHMVQPNGYYQPISDADGARVFVLGSDVLDGRPYLAIAAYLFNRSDFKFIGEKNASTVSWFLKSSEFEKYLKIQSKEPAQTFRAFPRSGYFVSRQNWSEASAWIFFDAGPVGLGQWPKDVPVGAHGHSDTLNFGFALGDQTFITDLGSYSYTTEQRYHQHFRSSHGHNVPIVDSQDENILLPSPWMLRQLAGGKNTKFYSCDEFDYFAGEHEGYARLNDPVICRREILFLKKRGQFLIRDNFRGKQDHIVKEKLHFYPGIKLTKKSRMLIAKSKDRQILIKPLFNAEIKIERTFKNSVTGWYALDYGKKVKAEEVELKVIIRGEESLVTTFVWGDNPLLENEVMEMFDRVVKIVTKPKVAMLVTNDLTNDPRVQKEAESLAKNGFEVKVFCFWQPKVDKILPVSQDGYDIVYLPYKGFAKFKLTKLINFIKKIPPKRIWRILNQWVVSWRSVSKEDAVADKPQVILSVPDSSQKISLGKIIRGMIYFYRLHHDFTVSVCDFMPSIVHSHDLDTLLAGSMIRKKIGAKLVYDAHEIWTEQSNSMPRALVLIGKIIEKNIIPKVDYFITVNKSLLKRMELFYPRLKNVTRGVILNLPRAGLAKKSYRKASKKIILYQGRFASDRGLEELVEAGRFLKTNSLIILRGFGDDDLKRKLEQIIEKFDLHDKVIIEDPVPMNEMIGFARSADIGVILYKPKNLNNYLASPNKLYEYTVAGLALLVSDLPELRQFVRDNNNGIWIKTLSPRTIARALDGLVKDNRLNYFKKNSKLKCKKYIWSNEENKLIEIYKHLIEEVNEIFPTK